MLYPICPLLGWGPLTHAFINTKSLKYIDEMGGINEPTVSKAIKKYENKNLFLSLAAMPDIIKSKGFLKGDTSYDYAHNPLPNRYFGNPQFSISLLKKALRENDEEGIILGLSWRAHQVSDVFAHHVPLNGWWGYVNSENFFGPFWREVENHLKGQDLTELAGSFYRADHWISELIIDLFCYIHNRKELQKTIFPKSPEKYLNSIAEISNDYLKLYYDLIKNDYHNIDTVQINEIKRGMKFSEALNYASFKYFDSLINKLSIGEILSMIANHDKFKYLDGMLSIVAFETARSLLNPLEEWKAPKVNAKLFIEGSKEFDKVFPCILSEDDKKHYYSKELEAQYKNYIPKREGIVKFVLEKTPLEPVKWIVLHTPLITSDGFINRMLLPKGRTSYALSLRYAFNIRNKKPHEKSFMAILRRTLVDANLIDNRASTVDSASDVS